MKLIVIAVAFLIVGCTYSINQVSTKGTASDVIDENQDASPDVSPAVSLPIANGASQPENYPPENPRGLNGLREHII